MQWCLICRRGCFFPDSKLQASLISCVHVARLNLLTIKVFSNTNNPSSLPTPSPYLLQRDVALVLLQIKIVAPTLVAASLFSSHVHLSHNQLRISRPCFTNIKKNYHSRIFQERLSATDFSIPSVTSNTSAGSGGSCAVMVPSSEKVMKKIRALVMLY